MVQAERHRSVVPLERARAAMRVPPVVRPAEVPGLQARREMAKRALREKPVQAEHPVTAERLEPEVLSEEVAAPPARTLTPIN